MTKEEKFLNYLSSLRTEANNELLECIVKGYGELLEYNEMGSASPNFSNNPTYQDNQLNTNPNSTGFQDNIMEDVENVNEDPDEIESQGNPEEEYTDETLGLEEGIGNVLVKGAKSIAANPIVRETAKNVASDVASSLIQKGGEVIKDKLNSKKQKNLHEFSPPAGVIVGTAGPMVKDENPFESGGEKADVNELKSLYKHLATALDMVETLIKHERGEDVDAEFILEQKK
jgi:hypothetical protein